MDISILNLSNLSNVAVIVIEENAEKLSRCIQTFAKNKRNIQIVTNEQSFQYYEAFKDVKKTYDSNKYDYVNGSTFVFDDCFAEYDWVKDKKLNDFISYPKMYGLTTVFGFRDLPALPQRMCWNLDLICIGNNPSVDTREKIYDSFFLYLYSYDTFCELLDNSTKDNGFLVLRREGTEDKVYVAKC